MSVTSAGRPRLTVKRRPGSTARDEILDAAGELFTTTGYTGTPTRTIAEAVGIRQASLYHYFKTKDEILCALLSQTVAPTLDFIPALSDVHPALSAESRLHVLAAFDGAQLVGSRWNLGVLYLQPELRVARLEPFWSAREELRKHYLQLSEQIAAAHEVDDACAELPFRLVESLVNMRAEQHADDRATLPMHVADACLRVLGVPENRVAEVRDRSREMLALETQPVT